MIGPGSPEPSAAARTAVRGRGAAIGQIDMRRRNTALILREVLREPRSRAQLAASVELTKPAVADLVRELEARGLVEVSTTPTRTEVGRPGHAVIARPNRVHGIGLSFSVVYLVGVVVDMQGRVVATEEVPLSWEESPSASLVNEAAALARRLARRAEELLEGSVLAGVAAAVPDLVDSAAGVVRRSPTTGLTDYPLREVLRAQLSDLAPAVAVDNDANFGGLAEARLRVADPSANLLYLTGSYGIGGGIIAGGEVFRGAGGFAGEIGHMLVNPGGAVCTCGSRGCLEAEVGLGAFLRRIADADDSIRDTRIGVDEHFERIIHRAHEGDARTLEAIQIVGAHIGVGLSGLISILNPDTVVLGGYFARIFPLLIPPIRRSLHERVMPELIAGCDIVPSALVSLTAAVGGAISVVDQLIADPSSVPLRAEDG